MSDERRCVATKNRFGEPLRRSPCGAMESFVIHHYKKVHCGRDIGEDCQHHTFQPAEEAPKAAQCECGHAADKHLTSTVPSRGCWESVNFKSCPCARYRPIASEEAPKGAAPEPFLAMHISNGIVIIRGGGRDLFGDNGSCPTDKKVAILNQEAEAWYQRRRAQESAQPCQNCERLSRRLKRAEQILSVIKNSYLFVEGYVGTYATNIREFLDAKDGE